VSHQLKPITLNIPWGNDFESQEWIDWAKKKIDWYDPFIQAEDDLLNDSDRTKIAEILIQMNKI
jgi:hypothetical protein